MDYTVHGILQAGIMEWVAFSFSTPGIEARSPALQENSLPAEPQKKLVERSMSKVNEGSIPGSTPEYWSR